MVESPSGLLQGARRWELIQRDPAEYQADHELASTSAAHERWMPEKLDPELHQGTGMICGGRKEAQGTRK